ncbi:AAA family ATPase [bacterium]|nr:AAA family ATPase [bacterium]
MNSGEDLMSSYKLANLIRARFPLIYITTFEEDRVTKYISSVVTDEKQVKFPREIYQWTQTVGLYNQTQQKRIPDTESPCKALEYIRKVDKDSVFILYDFHINFGPKNRTPDYNVIRKVRDIIPDLKLGQVRKTVFFVSPELLIPESLQKEITIYDFPLPDLEEIRKKLESMIKQNLNVENTLTEEEKDKLCKAALGLTLQEAESAFALAMVNDGKIDIKDLPIILEEKVQVIKKTGILEFIKSDYSIKDIGGLDNLKKWLLKRNNSWSEQAKKYCIPAPKGVLVTGVPGCGKSLTAKAMSTIWQLPLLKLDFSKVFSGLVGSSEENMRRALATAEAVAPSILWIDEIEKGLSGLGSNGDSGVSSRIFGQFLTWMQEKESPVFVIATANNISNLPPELLRKGRFDEIFFVDLPTFEERKEIFKLHLEKRLKDKTIASEIVTVPNLCSELAKMTEGFIGSEIEQVVVSALCDAFFESRPLKFEDLAKNIQTTVPLSTTQREQILSLRAWANVRAVSAAKTSDRTNYKKEIDNENVSSSRGGRTLDF